MNTRPSASRAGLWQASPQVARTSAFAIGAVVALLAVALRSPLFNASLSSPPLTRSLAGDYLAVDGQYGGLTSPYSLDAMLDHLTMTAPSTMALEIARPGITVTRAADGIRDAQAAEGAVQALGSTAELAPIRLQLLQSYRDVEHAWQEESLVESAFGGDEGGAADSLLSVPLSVQTAAEVSIAAIHQARAVHAQALEALYRLTGAAAPPSLPE